MLFVIVFQLPFNTLLKYLRTLRRHHSFSFASGYVDALISLDLGAGLLLLNNKSETRKSDAF